MRDTLFELANILRDRHHHLTAYRSPLRQHFTLSPLSGADHAAC
jgi:nitrogenase molybdenum-iron protein NifN